MAVSADLDSLADRVQTELGTIDALFVNAGIATLTPFESTTEQMFDELFGINVKGAFFTVQKLAPLLSAGAGVVLTTSNANVMGLLETSVYAAGKAALRSMARTLSGELLPRGIRVNAISPGPIDTGILENSMTAAAAAQLKAEMVAGNPMRRFGTPDEIARAAAFLAFDATYAAGIEFVMDGGATQL
ncbi:SDR family oxidoreductase [Nocardia sp. NPDC058480]|uniref:SDR family oxidoreductase n=1 Tax=unclassified Nocardia TaxID=2637762 RepID=UPI0036671EE0